jgi:hypothetical protein
MRHFLCCATLLLTGSTSVFAWADPAPPPIEKLAIAPISGSNVHPAYLEAARDILKDHLLGTGRFNVINLPGESGPTEITPEQALIQAREAGANLVVVTHLARLSGVGRVRMTAYRVPSGAMFLTDGIAIAGGPDDLDPALKRLAVSLATGKPAGKNADIESVTQKQSDQLIKETATKIFGVRVGAMFPFNRPANKDASAMPGLGLFWLYDARSFLGEISLDLHSGDSATSFDIGIGGYYPFSKENFTTYLGGSAAYAFGDLGHGIRIQPSFGFLFGRISTVQFRGEVGYFFNTFGERETDPNTYQTIGDAHFSHGPQFSVGLGF